MLPSQVGEYVLDVRIGFVAWDRFDRYIDMQCCKQIERLILQGGKHSQDFHFRAGLHIQRSRGFDGGSPVPDELTDDSARIEFQALPGDRSKRVECPV